MNYALSPRLARAKTRKIYRGLKINFVFTCLLV